MSKRLMPPSVLRPDSVTSECLPGAEIFAASTPPVTISNNVSAGALSLSR